MIAGRRLSLILVDVQPLLKGLASGGGRVRRVRQEVSRWLFSGVSIEGVAKKLHILFILYSVQRFFKGSWPRVEAEKAVDYRREETLRG